MKDKKEITEVQSFPSLSLRPVFVFPRRYGCSPLEEGAAGELANIRSLSALYLLNRYVLAPDSTGQLDEAYEMYQRMFGEQEVDCISPESLRDLIRLHIYKTGLVSEPDLSYLFGIDSGSVRVILNVAANKTHNVVVYQGEDVNYTQRSYYMYCPDKEPFRSYPLDPAVDYAGKTLSPRSLPHTYSIGLSESYIRLYSVHRPCYRTEFSYEMPLGNFQYTAPGKGKAGAAVVVDAFGVVRDSRLERENSDVAKVLLVEQDMGTENLGVLVGKLVDYSDTDYFDQRTSERCCMILSCHSILSINRLVPPRNSRHDVLEFVALISVSLFCSRRICGAI